MFNSIWYHSLIKPEFAPPNWIFTPVWIILYITIFTSLVLYYLADASDKRTGYTFFYTQLLLNLIWAPVFFGLKNILLAFVIIILLDIFVFLTIRKFYSVSKPAGILLVPYLTWISFATYLNGTYYVLNRVIG